ncbi:MAG: DNA (cytosine-5-)-methyltransferase [Clostridiales Family XIII bacterium]|nr:DNA (cytosine-5-)-methyltransferase [Clostridiales Family XIII bacterium]
MLTHFSLFSGIGGIDLAAEWAGFTTVGQVEWADYPTKVLEKHWPDVPRWRDIRELTYDKFVERTGLRTVDLISGGFPCQPYSVAGKRRGKDDERDLWPQMYRVIRELRPSWVLGENVAGLLSIDGGRRIGEIVQQLEDEHYQTRIILSPACNYGASFEGKRIFIIATTKSGGYRRCTSQKCRVSQWELVKEKQQRHQAWGETEGRIVRAIRTQKTLPDHLRSDYGLPDWVDRLKCLGNAVVPQQVYPILKAIAEIETP